MMCLFGVLNDVLVNVGSKIPKTEIFGPCLSNVNNKKHSYRPIIVSLYLNTSADHNGIFTGVATVDGWVVPRLPPTTACKMADDGHSEFRKMLQYISTG